MRVQNFEKKNLEWNKIFIVLICFKIFYEKFHWILKLQGRNVIFLCHLCANVLIKFLYDSNQQTADMQTLQKRKQMFSQFFCLSSQSFADIRSKKLLLH